LSVSSQIVDDLDLYLTTEICATEEETHQQNSIINKHTFQQQRLENS